MIDSKDLQVEKSIRGQKQSCIFYYGFTCLTF